MQVQTITNLQFTKTGVNIVKLPYGLTALYIALNLYIIPVTYSSLLTTSYMGIVFILYGLSFFYKNTIHIQVSELFVRLGLLLAYLIFVITSSFSKMSTTKNLLILWICFFIFQPKQGNEFVKWRYDWFYIITTIALCLQILIYLNDPYHNYKDFIIKSITDKNYTSLSVFCYFCYSIKKRYILGSLFGLWYCFFTHTRAYHIMFIILIAIIIIKKFIFTKERFGNSKIGRELIFLIFAGMLVTIILFSKFWVNEVVSNNPMSAYRESFNDESNAIRYSSNVYATQLIKGDLLFLVRGYDEDIFQELGLKSSDLSTHRTFNYFRIVQPHHIVLNKILRSGILLTLFYFLLISCLLEKYFIYDNLEYIIPFLFVSMIMHSVFDNIWLMVILYILNEPAVEKFVVRCKHNSKLSGDFLVVNQKV